MPDAFDGQIGSRHDSPDRAGVFRIMGDGPVLAVEALVVAAGHKYGIAFRRGRVEHGRCHLRRLHATDTGFSRQAVDPAAVLAQGAVFKIRVIHGRHKPNLSIRCFGPS